MLNHECRWRSGSVPLGLYTLYPWTGVVPGQFQLRSQDPDLPSAGLILRLWWLTGSGEALQPLLPWAIPLQFHSFYLTLGQQVVFQKLELQESPLLPTKVAVWPDTRHRRELNPGPVWWKVSALPLSHPDNPKHLGFFGNDPRDTRPKIYVSFLH